MNPNTFGLEVERSLNNRNQHTKKSMQTLSYKPMLPQVQSFRNVGRTREKPSKRKLKK